jgi:hypothetical protein
LQQIAAHFFDEPGNFFYLIDCRNALAGSRQRIISLILLQLRQANKARYTPFFPTKIEPSLASADAHRSRKDNIKASARQNGFQVYNEGLQCRMLHCIILHFNNIIHLTPLT